MDAVEAPKAPKEKKPKGPKPSSPSHPPYFLMIKEAILALHERNGSSSQAIAKHMEGKYKGVLPPNYKKILALWLKNFVSKGKLVKVKASFKLSESGEKDVNPTKAKKKSKAKKPEEVSAGSTKRKASSDAASPKKKPPVSAKSSKAKKPALTKPKPPKSIKSPVKKTNEVAA